MQKGVMSTLTHQLIAHQVVFKKLKIRSSSLINSSRPKKSNGKLCFHVLLLTFEWLAEQ